MARPKSRPPEVASVNSDDDIAETSREPKDTEMAKETTPAEKAAPQRIYLWASNTGQDASFSPPHDNVRNRYTIVIPAGASLVSNPDRGVVVQIANGSQLSGDEVIGYATKSLAGFSKEGASIAHKLGQRMPKPA